MSMRIGSTFLSCFSWPGMLRVGQPDYDAININEGFEIRQIFTQPTEMYCYRAEKWAVQDGAIGWTVP